MKKSFLLTAALVVVAIFTIQAQKKDLTLNDYMNRAIYPKSIDGLQWVPDGEKISYIENNKLVVQNVHNDDSDTLLSMDLLSGLMAEAGNDSLNRFPRIEWIDNASFSFIEKNKIFSYHFKDNSLKTLNHYSKEAEKSDIHTATKNVAYTLGQNLYVSINGKTVQITNDTLDGIANGVAVHRREFGITKGTFWSNGGRYLAYYHLDERMVTNYPLVDITSRVAEVENTRYPMAGMTSHQVKIAIFDTKTETTKYLDTQGEKDDYLTNITWGPKDEFIYVAELNREQNHMHLNKFKTKDGTFVKTLFEEKDDRYVEPEHELYFVGGKSNQFIWFSERDGYQHLYLYDTEGNLLKQLTSGEWVVQDIAGTGSNGKDLYFYATKNSPLNSDVFKVNIRNGKIAPVTQDMGTHHVILSDKNDLLIDVYTAIQMGRRYSVIDQRGKTITTMLTDKDPMKEYNLGEISVSSLKAADGTPLYYRLIKPANFDKAKKYPALVYVYGGPHAQLVTNRYQGGAGLFLNYMATKGYVVFTLDNRGSANRGFDFESVIHRNAGEAEVADQMTGIKFLKSLDYVDTTRIGVDGWSYGGFMTIKMKLEYPETFKVACAGGPVIDWKYYEVMYGERYMDTPESNPEGYEKASLLNQVEDLKGRLMIIHGTNDPTVVWQNSQQFVKKCVEHGKLLDYFIYPGHGHNVRGKDRIHLFKKIEQYFDTHL